MTNEQLKKQISGMTGCKAKDVKAKVKTLDDGYKCTVSVKGKEIAEYVGDATGLVDARNRALVLALETLKADKGEVKKEKPQKAGVKCHCGCGEITRYKRIFRQGHDARFMGRVRKLQDGRMSWADLKALIEPYAMPLYHAEVD